MVIDAPEAIPAGYARSLLRQRQGQLEPITILLYEWKLLSFNPMETYQLTDAEKAEVDFLTTLNKSGCSKNELKRVLKNLRRPYS